MKYDWLDEFCLSQAGAVKDYKEEWHATRYMVGGKMFAMQGSDKYNKAIITLKLDPARGDLLRQQYEDIIPGYYMNKQHWNSLYLDGDVPDEILRGMVVESHDLIFRSLSKKAQAEIEEGKNDR